MESAKYIPVCRVSTNIILNFGQTHAGCMIWLQICLENNGGCEKEELSLKGWTPQQQLAKMRFQKQSNALCHNSCVQ